MVSKLEPKSGGLAGGPKLVAWDIPDCVGETRKLASEDNCCSAGCVMYGEFEFVEFGLAADNGGA